MQPIKPGYKTSEFAATLAVMIVTLLVLFGLVEPADEQTLTGTVTDLLTGIAAVASAAHVVARYIQGRTNLKLQVLEKER